MALQERNAKMDREVAPAGHEIDFNEDVLIEDEPAAAATPARRGRAKVDHSVDDHFTKSLDATQLYLNEIGFSPLLTAEEEVYFARRALRGDEASRKRMIESNLRLVNLAT